MEQRQARWCAISLVGLVLCATASALINPNFTPTDLVRGASQVILLSASAPSGKSFTAEVQQTLRGAAMPAGKITFTVDDGGELTIEQIERSFLGQKTTPAVLVLARADERAADGAPAGAIQINTYWYAVHRNGDRWRLDRDQQSLETVWAGNAEMLARATTYVDKDPTAYFPVKSAITWDKDIGFGKMPGPVNGCRTADFGGKVGLGVLVLCDGGDRFMRAGSTTEPAADVTAKVKLTTRSKAATVGDFNGDGRIDLASWDGKSLHVAMQGEDGTFATAPAMELAECLSLDAIDAGSKASSLIVATSKGPVLLANDGKGSFQSRALPAPAAEDLGPAGICVVADFSATGRPDVMHLRTQGILFYAAGKPGEFAAPVVAKFPVIRNPRTAVCGDYDADGKLDIVVGGENGLAMLTRGPAGAWDNAINITGELAYHGHQNGPAVVASAPADINSDGRQGVILFFAKRNPMSFFNRGFSCFGLARELELAGNLAGTPEAPPAGGEQKEPPKLQAKEALQGSSQGGTALDLNGDGSVDLFSVNEQGEAWALLSSGERPPIQLTLTLPAGATGPVVVSVIEQKRRTGMHVVRPGVPAFVGRSGPGAFTLEWTGPDGKPASRKVLLEESVRVELTP